MLAERPRNIIVGLTFIAAIALCMYGIILLGKFQGLVGGLNQYQVTLLADNANGISSGAKVELNGIYAGQVESTWLAADAKGKLLANIKLKIDLAINIPASSTATLLRPAAVGNPYVTITATESTGPMLKKDGTAVLNATAPDSSLIPKEVFDDIRALKADLSTLSHQLTTVAQDLHVLLVYTPPEVVDNADPKDPNSPKANASTAVIRLDRTIASLQQLLGDPKLQGQVRTIVQNIGDASERLKSTLEKVDSTLANANSAVSTIGTSVSNAANAFGTAATQASVSLQSTQRDISRVSQQLIETLAQLEKTTKQLSEGNGTTGRLINDPRLYEGLVDLSKSLKSTVEDLDFLLNKWKDEGVKFNLK